MRIKIPAFVLGLALLVGGLAWAGDEAPTASPTVEAKAPEAGSPATAKPATATPSPMHSILKWVGSHVVQDGSPCPSTAEGEAAWRTWFSGGAEVPLAGLRDALVKDGWNADRTVGFFQAMAAKAGSTGSSSSCDKCGDCPSKCEKCGDCASKCDKSGSCRGSCDKGAKKASGAPASPTGDAAPAAGQAAKGKSCGGDGACPCTGKPRSECPGCDKEGCPCGGKTAAPAPKG